MNKMLTLFMPRFMFSEWSRLGRRTRKAKDTLVMDRSFESTHLFNHFVRIQERSERCPRTAAREAYEARLERALRYLRTRIARKPGEACHSNKDTLMTYTETHVCSRDMSAEILRCNRSPEHKVEYLVFSEGKPLRMEMLCNEPWATATSLYWALAKVEALGVVGEQYTLITRAEYAARPCYNPPPTHG